MNQIIPPPHPTPFIGAIVHPELYLWDSWSYRENNVLHLYCLAISRYNNDNELLDPAYRNNSPFHVRHFMSDDNAATWIDKGSFQQPRLGSDSFDSRTVWSGSVTLLNDGRKLVAYTGIRELGENLVFQQSMGVALSPDGNKLVPNSEQLISCSYADWQDITDLGYYLGEREFLGNKDGEKGGPIMAWRDPFVLAHQDELYMFWCAKVNSHTSALGCAKLSETHKGFAIEKMYPPVIMPDSELFTQLELPKVIYDDVKDKWYLIISTCNRLYEGQADSEVDKQVRLYESKAMTGPWLPLRNGESKLIFDEQDMFGLTVIDANFERGELRIMAPYTGVINSEKGLSISAAFSIYLDSVNVSQKKLV